MSLNTITIPEEKSSLKCFNIVCNSCNNSADRCFIKKFKSKLLCMSKKLRAEIIKCFLPEVLCVVSKKILYCRLEQKAGKQD